MGINYNFSHIIRDHCQHNGRCPGSGPNHQHILRLGKNDEGQWRTATAKIYPTHLCEAMAHFVMKACEVNLEPSTVAHNPLDLYPS
eukprot:5354755-Karenia_brevis.AAC.1